MRSAPHAARAYTALVRLYPRSFRDQYGDDMVALFRDQCRDEPTGRVIARALVDLALTVPTQHLEARMDTNPTPLAVVGFLVVAVAGLSLAVVGGSNSASLVWGGVMAVGGGALAVITLRRGTPIHGSAVTANWWKFLLAGPALIGGVILGAGLGLDAWFFGLGVVALGVLLTAVGVALAAAHLVRSRAVGRI